MSSEKDTLITWNEAVELFKSKPDDTACIRQAADKLETLIDGQPQQGVSKLCYNVSILRMLLGDKIKALKYLNACLEKDPHNAMAYFQRATVHFQLNRYVESAKDNQKCVDCMRQATVIDYAQLGLRCKLYQHEAIYNEGACHLQLGSREKCLDALQEVESLIKKDASIKTLDVSSSLQTVQRGSNSIEIVERGTDRLYTPPANKLNNLKKKNYLGKAKVVSSVQSGDNFTGFEGPNQLALPKNVQKLKKTPPERPSSPRPMTPENSHKDRDDSSSSSNGGDPALITDLVKNLPSRLSSDSSSSSRNSADSYKPDAPSRPPPKLPSSDRPSPAPRAVPVPATRITPAAPSKPQTPPTKPLVPPTKPEAAVPAKPAAAPKPTLCKIELIAGELVENITLSSGSNFIKLMDEVAKKFSYEPDTYSLWYLNRQGSYTAIDNQEVMEHVWKWKVKKNQLTVYVFGV